MESNRAIAVPPVQGADVPLDARHLLGGEGLLPALFQADLGRPRQAHAVADDVVVDRPEIVEAVPGGHADEAVDLLQHAVGIGAEVLVPQGYPAAGREEPARVLGAVVVGEPGAGGLVRPDPEVLHVGPGDRPAVAHEVDDLHVEAPEAAHEGGPLGPLGAVEEGAATLDAGDDLRQRPDAAEYVGELPAGVWQDLEGRTARRLEDRPPL